MAARKKKTATKKAAGGALAKRRESAVALPTAITDEFGDFASRDKASATQSGGMPWISTQGGGGEMRLNVGGEMRPVGGPDGLDVIILGGNRGNLYYEGDFEPGVFRPPTCFAVASLDWPRGEVESLMAPPADLATKQDDRCKDCRWNAFGSANRGRGKACKNTVRLMLLPPDASDYEKAEGYMLSVPPTSLAAWSKYVARVVDGLNRPVASLVTRIKKVPAEKGAGFNLTFEPVDLFTEKDHEKLVAIAGRVKGDARTALEAPPPVEAADDSRATGGGKPRAQRRKVTRRGGKGRA